MSKRGAMRSLVSDLVFESLAAWRAGDHKRCGALREAADRLRALLDERQRDRCYDCGRFVGTDRFWLDTETGISSRDIQGSSQQEVLCPKCGDEMGRVSAFLRGLQVGKACI